MQQKRGHGVFRLVVALDASVHHDSTNSVVFGPINTARSDYVDIHLY